MDFNVFIEEFKKFIGRIWQQTQKIQTSERDKKILLIGGIFFFVLVLFLIFQFFSSGSEKLVRKALSLDKKIVESESLKTEYEEINRRIGQLTRSIKTVDEALISVVEKILVDENIQRSDFSIKDSNTRDTSGGDLYDEKSVYVEIKKIPLRQLVDLLYKIQTRPSFLKVSNLRIRTRFDSPDLMDISFRISTFEFKKEI